MVDPLLNALVHKKRHPWIVSKEHGRIDLLREPTYDLFDVRWMRLIKL